VDVIRDYSIVGPERDRAIDGGLAEADWYRTPVDRDEMRTLVERSNGRAAADTMLWLVLLIGSGLTAAMTWGTWYAVPAFALYGVLYGSACDSRWHECGHGTAFKAQWANSVVYYLASFMAFREPLSWRWSHARHHDDTIIVGRDLEIAVPRPTSIPAVIAEFLALRSIKAELAKLGAGILGHTRDVEKDYIPQADWARVILWSRIFSLVWLGAVVWSLAIWDLRPILFIGGPTVYGRWLMVTYGLTQHAGLAENVLDHRLNSRTVMMNPIHRFMYLNMNYHIEHHMFPTVPYHALPTLHQLVKDDMPPIYPSIAAAYREIVPALRTQAKDPDHFVHRPVEEGVPLAPRLVGQPVVQPPIGTEDFRNDDHWHDVRPVDDFDPSDIVRFDHGRRTFAVYRTDDDRFFATDGACTHGRVHLSEGFLHGTVVECAKHNGRFEISTGAAQGRPVIVDLGCHPVRVVDGMVQIRVQTQG